MAESDLLNEASGATATDAGRYVACVVCGGRPLIPLRRFAHAHLVRCPRCDLTFAGQRPTDEELENHYRSYGTGWLDSSLTRHRYNELLDDFEPYRKGNRILDIGCGAGYFLEEATRRGWDAYGSEFGELARSLSGNKGFTVVNAPISPELFPTGHFDVITAFEVVEHLRDPVAEALVITSLLRRQGLFYCTTPNFNSVSRLMLGKRWQVVEYPEHLLYFTPRTINRWLHPVGLEPLRVRTTGIAIGAVVTSTMDSLAQGFADHPSSSAIDQRVRTTIEESHLLRAAKTLVNASLAPAGLGDNLKGWFIKQA